MRDINEGSPGDWVLATTQRDGLLLVVVVWREGSLARG